MRLDGDRACARVGRGGKGMGGGKGVMVGVFGVSGSGDDCLVGGGVLANHVNVGGVKWETAAGGEGQRRWW